MKYAPIALIVAAFALPAAAQQTSALNTAGDAANRSAADVKADAIGGYAPTQPALRGSPQPGSPIVFVPSPPPAEAFPAPAPLAHYPPCKRGQFDNCRQVRDPR